MTANHEVLPRVLIVDDDPAMVIALGRALHGLASTRFASNGRDALDHVAREAPDLILLDMEMAGMSGLDVIAQLKRASDTAHIPVIFVTSHVEPAFEEAVFNAGAADYIAKPLSPRVVNARVKAHLSLARALRQLREMAMQDALTGLHNRRAFDERLEQEWARAQRQGGAVALLIIDVDEFKKYNDHFGHPGGDSCLQKVAKALQSVCRRADDFVARYGGEEFVLLFPDTPPGSVDDMAEKSRAAVEALGLPQAPNANRETVTISVGCCTAHLHSGRSEMRASRMLETADAALYEAKRQGRNRVVSRNC